MQVGNYAFLPACSPLLFFSLFTLDCWQAWLPQWSRIKQSLQRGLKKSKIDGQEFVYRQDEKTYCGQVVVVDVLFLGQDYFSNFQLGLEQRFSPICMRLAPQVRESGGILSQCLSPTRQPVDMATLQNGGVPWVVQHLILKGDLQNSWSLHVTETGVNSCQCQL